MYLFVALATLLMSLGCGGSTSGDSAGRFAYVLVNPGQLRAINLFMGTPVSSAVTLSAGNIRDIAMRASDGQLFGLGSDLKLYSINPDSGSCTVISAAPLAIDGYNGGLTFQPSSSTLRFCSSGGNNYTIDASTGTLLSTDTATGLGIHGLAAQTSSGNYFAFSASSDQVYKSTNIATGAFTTVGASGVDMSGDVGMAIDNQTGKAYVVGDEGLFLVNLSTGAFTMLSATSYDDIAVIP